METDSILIQNNATSRKELQNLQQRTTGNCESFSEIVIISLDVRELFEIWIDYENLKYFRKPHKLNRQQAR